MAREGHKFNVANRGHLDSEERRSYLDAARILGAFHLPEGGRIADIGCGTGFFAVPAAALVGPRGLVYALDVSEEMLADLRVKLAKGGIRNVEPRRSIEDKIPLDTACVDFVFMACVLHELDGPGTLFECRRILRPTGRLGVVDWKKEDMEFGPPKAHRLDLEEAVSFVLEAGFGSARTFEAGPYHYGIEARIRRP